MSTRIFILMSLGVGTFAATDAVHELPFEPIARLGAVAMLGASLFWILAKTIPSMLDRHRDAVSEIKETMDRHERMAADRFERGLDRQREDSARFSKDSEQLRHTLQSMQGMCVERGKLYQNVTETMLKLNAKLDAKDSG